MFHILYAEYKASQFDIGTFFAYFASEMVQHSSWYSVYCLLAFSYAELAKVWYNKSVYHLFNDSHKLAGWNVCDLVYERFIPSCVRIRNALLSYH